MYLLTSLRNSVYLLSILWSTVVLTVQIYKLIYEVKHGRNINWNDYAWIVKLIIWSELNHLPPTVSPNSNRVSFWNLLMLVGLMPHKLYYDDWQDMQSQTRLDKFLHIETHTFASEPICSLEAEWTQISKETWEDHSTNNLKTRPEKRPIFRTWK